jgi:phi13 family phage major tail protein
MSGTLTSGVTNSPFIGVQNLHFAELLTDESGGAATYGEIISFPRLIEVQISPQTSSVELYADNAAVDSSSVISKYDLTFSMAGFPLEYKAKLLGHTIDENGVMKVNKDDSAPYFAVMFESDKRNNKKRFVKFFKVQFQEPEETAHTKEANISYNTPTMKATAIYRTCDGLALAQADEEQKAGVGDTWYTSVDPVVAP